MQPHRVIPVILSGGAGTRLWPLSRADRPKQVLALGGTEPLISATAARTADAEGFADPVIVAGAGHRELIAAAMAEHRIGQLILEPAARNTAPAIALAAHAALGQNEEAILLVMPSDHRIADVRAFHGAIANGLKAAADDELVTFGIRPSRPETGYGYIESGAQITDGVHRVAAFHEKPNKETAARYVRSGRFFWNAGIFLFRAGAYLEALGNHAPQIAAASAAAYNAAEMRDSTIWPDAEAFAKSPSQSIDYAVMETAARRAVVPVDMGWSDIGSFEALYNELPRDGQNNALHGDAVILEGSNNLLWSEGPAIAALGIEGLAVVVTETAVLVIPKSRAQDVKTLLAALEASET